MLHFYTHHLHTHRVTSPLDSILSTTTQTQLSECSPTPPKEIDTNIDTPVSNQSPQKTTASEHVQTKSPPTNRTGDQPIPLPDTSHQEQVKDDSTDTVDQSESKFKWKVTRQFITTKACCSWLKCTSQITWCCCYLWATMTLTPWLLPVSVSFLQGSV